MSAIAFRPPAPRPRTKPLGLLARIAALRRNPIEIWTKAHYEVPVTQQDCVRQSRGG